MHLPRHALLDIWVGCDQLEHELGVALLRELEHATITHSDPGVGQHEVEEEALALCVCECMHARMKTCVKLCVC